MKFDGNSMDMTLAHFASSVGIGIVESVAGDSCVICTGMGTKEVHLLKNLKLV